MNGIVVISFENQSLLRTLKFEILLTDKYLTLPLFDKNQLKILKNLF